jgi:hypothetical protein
MTNSDDDNDDNDQIIYLKIQSTNTVAKRSGNGSDNGFGNVSGDSSSPSSSSSSSFSMSSPLYNMDSAFSKEYFMKANTILYQRIHQLEEVLYKNLEASVRQAAALVDINKSLETLVENSTMKQQKQEKKINYLEELLQRQHQDHQQQQQKEMQSQSQFQSDDQHQAIQLQIKYQQLDDNPMTKTSPNIALFARQQQQEQHQKYQRQQDQQIIKKDDSEG